MINRTQINGVQINGSSIVVLNRYEEDVTDEVTVAGEALRHEKLDILDTINSYIVLRQEAGYNLLDLADSVSSIEKSEAVKPRLYGVAEGVANTFYNPTQEAVLEIRVGDTVKGVYALAEQLLATADVYTVVSETVLAWLAAVSEGDIETRYKASVEQLLRVVAYDTSTKAVSEAIEDLIEVADTYAQSTSLRVLELAAAELFPESVMSVGIQETLYGYAADSNEATGKYRASVKDLVGASVVFKLSSEVVAGWVMNVEGDQPFSQYDNFEFNSFATIGGRHLAASDSGTYMLGGDTDDSQQIGAHVTTMMLDFGTPRQKRVVAAYLGYTATGRLVLKVRSNDGGQLVEHWYEAKDKVADAPTAGYAPLGRGLKSRYWQFTLANEDGADFEIDQLELYPLVLNRRV